MTIIICKAFVSQRCGHSIKYLNNSWIKLQQEFTKFNGYDIKYEKIENTPENSHIFKQFKIRGFPKTFLVFNHIDGERHLEAISGNAPYGKCKNIFTRALSKIISEKKEWEKHLSNIEIAKKAENEEKRIMSYANMFLKEPKIRKQLEDYANSKQNRK